MNDEKFWIQDPSILYTGYINFYPDKKMNNNAQLNALTRFAIYLAIILTLFRSDSIWFYIPVFIFLLSLLLYYLNSSDILKRQKEEIDPKFREKVEKEEAPKCQKPSINNPYMNILQSDYTTNPVRPPACDYDDKDISQQLDDSFTNNLYENVDDIFVDKALRRQFYTTPATTIPNDQQSFANWLYGEPKTCKQDNSNCLEYEDIRIGRDSFGKPFGS